MINMCKTALAMLASLALTATLEVHVGYVVYLKNTVTPIILFPRWILVPSYDIPAMT